MGVQELPAEIFFNIFSYVPATELASNVSLVCRQWRAFYNDEFLWKYYCSVRWRYMKKTPGQDSWLSYFKFNMDRRSASFLILGAEGGKDKSERLLDVQEKLITTGLKTVDILNVRAQVPTLDMLRNYHAVMIFSYHGFDQKLVGNALAEYVDLGGGVVTCAYNNCGPGNRLEGRWLKGQYDPLVQGHTLRVPQLRLGAVCVATHPVMKGVRSFNGGEQSSHGDSRPHPEAKTIAEWSNGRPLVVELSTRRGAIVALNMYPPSADAAVGGWDPSCDGAVLLANALHYAATRPC